MQTTKAKIRQFIESELITKSDTSSLEDHDDLLMSNMLDSLGVMRLVEYLERMNATKIPPEDITLENFQSVNKIATYLSAQVGQTALGK